MLYEYNGKIYIKPFTNKLVEVQVTKNGNEYDVKPSQKLERLTPEIKEKMVEITLEDAYKKMNKNSKDSLDRL